MQEAIITLVGIALGYVVKWLSSRKHESKMKRVIFGLQEGGEALIATSKWLVQPNKANWQEVEKEIRETYTTLTAKEKNEE